MSSQNNFASVSRIDIKGIIENKEVLTGQLIRHLAPLSISQLLRVFPLQGRVHYYVDVFFYMQTQLNIGQEKPRKNFQREILLSCHQMGHCVFSSKMPMSHIP